MLAGICVGRVFGRDELLGARPLIIRDVLGLAIVPADDPEERRDRGD